ncbi:retrovirus-related Pol polyprotein from transposon 17.6 [Trichonephila clavipes]|nr:retrovirus-related Pol polyprotein from transposon 17.6 [Trichonephila clavipes]
MNSVRYMKRQQCVPPAEKNDEALDRVTLDYLSKKQQTQLKDLLHRHRTLFSGKIKRAKVGEHVIKLQNEEETMKPKTYKIPENLEKSRRADRRIVRKLECPYRPGRIPNAEYDGVEFLSREEKIYYCTRYVENSIFRTYIAKLSLPLTELTKKKVCNEIPWSKEAENAFMELKTELCGITELQVQDIEKPHYFAYGCFSDGGRMLWGQLDGEDNIHPYHLGARTEPKPSKSGQQLKGSVCYYLCSEKDLKLYCVEQRFSY